MLELIKTEKYDKHFDELILICLSLYIFCMQIRESALFDIFIIASAIKIAIRMTFLFVVLKDIYDLLRGKFKLKEIIFIFVFGIYFSYFYISLKQANLLIIFLYLVAFKNINYDKFNKHTFFALMIPFIIIVLLSFTPFLNDYSKIQIRYGNLRVRHYLGYYFTCALNYFMSIVFMYYLFKKEFKPFDYIWIIVLNVFLLIFTDTKSSFFCIVLLLLLNVLFINVKNNKIYKIFSFLTLISFPIGALSTFVLTYLYSINNRFAVALNDVLTGRLRLMSEGFDRWGITLFGQNIYNSTEYGYIDSSYLNIFFNYGVIALIIVVVFYIVWTYWVSKKRNLQLLIVLFITSLHSVFDPQLTLLYYSPFIILFMYYYNA